MMWIHLHKWYPVTTNNYFDKLLDFIYKAVDDKFVHEKYLEMIIIEHEPAVLLDKMSMFEPIKVRKWIGNEDIWVNVQFSMFNV